MSVTISIDASNHALTARSALPIFLPTHNIGVLPSGVILDGTSLSSRPTAAFSPLIASRTSQGVSVTASRSSASSASDSSVPLVPTSDLAPSSSIAASSTPESNSLTVILPVILVGLVSLILLLLFLIFRTRRKHRRERLLDDESNENGLEKDAIVSLSQEDSCAEDPFADPPSASSIGQAAPVLFSSPQCNVSEPAMPRSQLLGPISTGLAPSLATRELLATQSSSNGWASHVLVDTKIAHELLRAQGDHSSASPIGQVAPGVSPLQGLSDLVVSQSDLAVPQSRPLDTATSGPTTSQATRRPSGRPGMALPGSHSPSRGLPNAPRARTKSVRERIRERVHQRVSPTSPARGRRHSTVGSVASSEDLRGEVDRLRRKLRQMNSMIVRRMERPEAPPAYA